MEKVKISRKMVSIYSVLLGVTLIGLYIYTSEEAVAIGGLVGHLWLVTLANFE